MNPWATPVVDPWQGAREGANALRQMAADNQTIKAMQQQQEMEQRQLQMQHERLGLERQRETRMAENDQWTRQQANIEAATRFIPALTKDSYADFLDWLGDPKVGGASVPVQLMRRPEEVAAMSDVDFDKYKRSLYFDAKQLAEMDLAKFKSTVEGALADRKHRQAVALEGVKHDYGMQEEAFKQQGDVGLELLKQQGSEGLTPAQRATQRQRIRAQVAKLWGFSEFSKLDDQTAKKIEDATLKAAQYFEDGLDPDEAIAKANNEIRVQEAITGFPKAEHGTFRNNKPQTIRAIEGLKALRITPESIRSILKNSGWGDQDVQDIMDRSELYGPPAETGYTGGTAEAATPPKAAAPRRFEKTATNPETGERVGWDGKQWVPIR